jgi:hypothetical protein
MSRIRSGTRHRHHPSVADDACGATPAWMSAHRATRHVRNAASPLHLVLSVHLSACLSASNHEALVPFAHQPILSRSLCLPTHLHACISTCPRCNHPCCGLRVDVVAGRRRSSRHTSSSLCRRQVWLSLVLLLWWLMSVPHDHVLAY